MQISPWFIGACAVACVSGGIAGASIAADPVMRGDTQWLDTVPRHEIAQSPAAVLAMQGPQDHYDLHTPSGVIKVAELAHHGRLRDRKRDQPYFFGEEQAEEPVELQAAQHEATEPVQPEVARTATEQVVVEADAPFIALQPATVTVAD